MGCFASALETSQFAVEGVDEGASGFSAYVGNIYPLELSSVIFCFVSHVPDHSPLPVPLR